MGKSIPVLNFTQLTGKLDSLEQQVSQFVTSPGRSTAPHDGRTVDEFKPFLVALNLTKRCNLKCAHCYLDATTKAGGGSDELTTEECYRLIGQIAEVNRGCLLVITGGEPLLQQRDLTGLVADLKSRGFYFEVETNGTLVPIPELARDIDQWNVSPKLETSGNPLDRRVLPQVLESFRQLPGAYFKFVVVEPQDVEEVCAMRDKYKLPTERIVLLPEGTTVEQVQRRSQWVSEVCVREGFRFSTRLHILLWGDQRGR